MRWEVLPGGNKCHVTREASRIPAEDEGEERGGEKEEDGSEASRTTKACIGYTALLLQLGAGYRALALFPKMVWMTSDDPFSVLAWLWLVPLFLAPLIRRRGSANARQGSGSSLALPSSRSSCVFHPFRLFWGPDPFAAPLTVRWKLGARRNNPFRHLTPPSLLVGMGRSVITLRKMDG